MLRDRRRILVVGCSGAGKSTLATRLGRAIGLPVIHLDRHYWRPGWVPTPDDEFDGVLAGLLDRPEWIMDGNYDRTLPDRLERADAVLFLDLPPRVCRYRVLKRILSGYGRDRPDLGVGCPEQWDWAFLRWVWTWPRDVRPRVVAPLERADPRVQVIRLRTAAEVRALERSVAAAGEALRVPSPRRDAHAAGEET